MLQTLGGALAAQLLVLGVLHVSAAVARRMVPVPCSPAERWTATAVVGLWLATAGFHLLLLAEGFTLPAALGSVALLSAAAHLVDHRDGSSTWSRLRRDLRWPVRLWRAARRGRWGWLAWVLPGVALATVVRTLLLPPLGWDTVTYHGVKAAMWVQDGAVPAFVAPGGWGFYRSFFGGGEVLTAWAMLPMSSELFAGFVDAVCWILSGVAVYALARTLGVRSRRACAAASFVLFLPALRLSVGSGYVEPAVNLCMFAAVLFAVRWVQTRQPSWLVVSVAALGLAVNVKLTAAPLAVVVALVLAVAVARAPGTERARAGRALLLGLTAAVAVVGPWMVRNVNETGAPLSPLPVRVAGVTLGKATDALHWHEDRPGLMAYEPGAELGALEEVFASPLSTEWPHASAASLVPLALLPFAGVSLVRRRPFEGAVVLGATGSLVAGFYSPGFSVVRILWAEVNGRFLVPVVALATCTAFAALSRPTRRIPLAAALAAVLWASTLVHALVGVGAGLGRWELTVLPVAVVTVLLGIVVIAVSATRLPRAPLVGAVVVVVAVAIVALQRLGDATWERAVSESVVFASKPFYWLPAATALEDEDPGRRVAVTAGPRQASDHWHIYPVLGRRFQHTVTYVPPTASGDVVDTVPFRAAPELDAEAWEDRLVAAGVTHVMAFSPESPELLWVRAQPERFPPVVEGPDWGLYRVDG